MLHIYTVVHFAAVELDDKISTAIHAYRGTMSEKPVGGPPSLVFTNKGYLSRKEILDDKCAVTLDPTGYHDEAKILDTSELEKLPSILINFITVLKKYERSEVKDHGPLTIITEVPIIFSAIKAITDAEVCEKFARSKVPLKYLAAELNKTVKGFGKRIVIMTPDINIGRHGYKRAEFNAAISANFDGDICGYEDWTKKSVYWKGWKDRPELLAFRFLGMSTSVPSDGYLICTEPHKGNYYNVGKISGKCGYSVVHLKEPEEILEKFDFHIRSNTDDNTLLAIDLGHVYNKSINSSLQKSFKKSFRSTNDYAPVFKYVLDDVPLVVTTRPVNMVMHGLERCGHLKDILKRYEKNQDETDALPVTIEIFFSDVTEHFYESNIRGKKIVMVAKPTIKKGGPSTSFRKPKSNTWIRLRYNSDIPTNHRISRMAHVDTKVIYVCWTTEKNGPKHYAMIWDTPNGTAIYSNLDTNRIY